MAASTVLTARAARFAALSILAGLLAGCMTDKTVTGSVSGSVMPTSASREVATPEQKQAHWRALSERYGQAYAKNPSDPAAGYGYGLALRALGQRAQALAVLEQSSMKNPGQKQILAAYGRSLADVGRYDEALGVLARAHTPDRPDWKILNAQGAILDQLGRSEEARGYYLAAIKIAPGEPSILSNLGLNYALSGDLANAQQTLQQAAASPKADEKVRANLALVLSLKSGKAAAPAKSAKAARTEG